MLKVAIDAGHGRYTPGKRCLKSIDSNETREWVLNSRIANKVVKHLEKSGITVLRLDDISGELDISLIERTNLCNKFKPEAMVSIHHDAGIAGGSGGGATVYVYSGKHSSASDNLQKNVYECFTAEVGKFGNRSKPLQEKNLHMVRESKCPAILIECGFMDSIRDTPMILTESFSEKAARGIAKGICKTLGIIFHEEGEEEMIDVKKEVFDLNNTGDNPSEWAKNATEWSKKERIFSGDDNGNYGWQKSITREQLAFILYNMRNYR